MSQKYLKPVIAATGTVFGDIGTSPLYAISALVVALRLFASSQYSLLCGAVSLLIWILFITVSLMYINRIMRIGNSGEGGVLAQVSVLLRTNPATRVRHAVIALGIVGTALFLGDGVITPAISMLSAVEGLHVALPLLSHIILPVVFVLVSLLFALQPLGVGKIGAFFGPLMIVWFLSIGIFGLIAACHMPAVFIALLPTTAVGFAIGHPLLAFLLGGTLILAITGAEALYADMGQFGRTPISLAWHGLIFPSLVCCYLGQLAIMAQHPTVHFPFFVLFPAWLQLPAVILATIATFIASQAVIAGTYSLIHQAMRLGYLPHMRLRHLSGHISGQIYIPLINIILYCLVVLLILIFQSSVNLAGAYGLAVSGALVCDALLYLVVVRRVLHANRILVGLTSCTLPLIPAAILISSLGKIPQGGLLPLLLAGLIIGLIYTWVHYHQEANRVRIHRSETIDQMTEFLNEHRHAITRTPGSSVYIGHHEGYVPLALMRHLKASLPLPRHVILLYIESSSHAHVASTDRLTVLNHHYNDGIVEVRLRYGYMDSLDIEADLRLLPPLDYELREFDVDHAHFVISAVHFHRKREAFFALGKALYIFLANLSADDATHYHLPPSRTNLHTSRILL